MTGLFAAVTPTPTWYLVLGAVLFGIGAFGVMARRNPLVLFMCIELMLNAVNLAFITFSRSLGTLDGQVLVFFVMVVAAAEASVGLAIVIAVHRHKDTLDVDALSIMKW